MTPLIAISPADYECEPLSLMDQARAAMPWVMSVTFHVGLLMILLFMAQRMQKPPEPPQINAGVQAAIDDEPMNINWEWSDSSSGLPEAVRSALSPAESPQPVIDSPVGPPRVLHPPENSPRGIGNFGGGVGKASFCGLGRKAGRIVYVVDRSGSMFNKFDYLRAKLNESIANLTGRQEFCVLCFADDRPMELTIDGQSGWHRARDYAKAEARKWIQSVATGSRGGRTDPVSALRRAFSLPGARPDVVFLLTDGRFTNEREVVAVLNELNRDRKVHVCTISFIGQEGGDVLEQIARTHGGSYAHVTEDDLAGD